MCCHGPFLNNVATPESVRQPFFDTCNQCYFNTFKSIMLCLLIVCMVHDCMYILHATYLFIEIACLTYKPVGICQDFQSIFDHPVKIAVNTSHAGNISASQRTSFIFHHLLTSELTVHKQCLNVLLPFVCRWVFPTCDPAFNVSVEQYICRRACEILTNFVCNEVWLYILSQIGNLRFLAVNIPICDFLERSNGGDAPDCINTLDGGR